VKRWWFFKAADQFFILPVIFYPNPPRRAIKILQFLDRHAWKMHIESSKRTILNIENSLIDEAVNITGIKKSLPRYAGFGSAD
jgi:hypothetical protein